MKKLFHVFVFFAVAIALTRVHEAYIQTDAPQIALLDRTGRIITSIIDGNRVQLCLELGGAVDTALLMVDPNSGEIK